MRHYIMIALGVVVGFFVGLFIGKARTDKPPGSVVETVESTVDTIPYYTPMHRSELALGTHHYTLPVNCFMGGGSGGAPRQCQDNDSLNIDRIDTAHYGTGFGGEPRCSEDSVIVELQMVQRHYADSTYEAWISGPLDPRLDSVKVYAPTTIITKREWKPPKRWHIGLTAGYGYGINGMSPYIGIGITYSIYDLSF